MNRAMTQEEKKQKGDLLQKALSGLNNDFDCVQIVATCQQDGVTASFSRGFGNWYARIGLARELVQESDADIIAGKLKEET